MNRRQRQMCIRDRTSSTDKTVKIDAAYVNAQLAEAASSQDLARYVL